MHTQNCSLLLYHSWGRFRGLKAADHTTEGQLITPAQKHYHQAGLQAPGRTRGCLATHPHVCVLVTHLLDILRTVLKASQKLREKLLSGNQPINLLSPWQCAEPSPPDPKHSWRQLVSRALSLQKELRREHLGSKNGEGLDSGPG